MKNLALIIGVIGLFISSALAQEMRTKQVEVIRSAVGKVLNPAGVPTGDIILNQGQRFDTFVQKPGFVVVKASTSSIAIRDGDYELKDRVAGEARAEAVFVPGKIVLISARYTLEGNQPRNVKLKLSKLIPELVTEPVEIMVSDDLSRATANQGNLLKGTVDSQGNVTLVEHKNVLTVEYSFNGTVRKKQAVEGSILVLP